MKIKLALGAIVAAGIGFASTAANAQLFDLSSPDPLIQAQFNATLLSSTPGYGYGYSYFGPLIVNTYQITSISGTVNGLAITGISNYENASNQLKETLELDSKASGYVITSLSFSTSKDTYYVGASYSGFFEYTPYYMTDSAGSVLEYRPRDISISPKITDTSAVPEASTWVMMLAGFAGLGFVGYRRSKAALAA